MTKQDKSHFVATMIVLALLPYMIVGFIKYTDWAVGTAIKYIPSTHFTFNPWE